MLISSWKAPKDGGWLHGLYSFNEDFGGTGNFQRKALSATNGSAPPTASGKK